MSSILNADTNRINIYQIFYDENTRSQIDPHFIPLDNSTNSRPDWYEFWVIKNFLENNPLKEDCWYGFLSPKFSAKTGISGEIVHELVKQCDAFCNVVLFHSSWDQLSYFQNIFEQGEYWHPGLTALTQNFLSTAGIDFDLSAAVMHCNNSVFSNYVIAKPEYWRKWLELAKVFFEFVETSGVSVYKGATSYGSEIAPMKTFIQERLSSIVLTMNHFNVGVPDLTATGAVYERMYDFNPQLRRLLQTCDILKQRYSMTSDNAYLDMYRKIRSEIRLRPLQDLG